MLVNSPILRLILCLLATAAFIVWLIASIRDVVSHFLDVFQQVGAWI